jgi:hypothetical protein
MPISRGPSLRIEDAAVIAINTIAAIPVSGSTLFLSMDAFTKTPPSSLS